jgi:hypothetical protein
MLWKLTTTNKYGNLRSRIVHSDGALTIGQGFGSFVGVKLFRYESRTPYHGIMTSPIDGKKYLTPDWIEVHPQTTLADIVYNAPKPEKEKPTQWDFKSDSSDAVYKVRYNGVKLTCNCPGSWRAFDRRCKHIKSVESQIK